MRCAYVYEATSTNIWSKMYRYGSNLCSYLILLASSNSSFSCLSKIAAAIYLTCTLVSLASLLCRHKDFAASRHVNSRHRQRSRCQHHLASQGTAQTCTVVQCDYSHSAASPLFQTAPTISMSSESVSLSSFVCRYVSVSAHPAMLKSRNITACRSSGYVTEHWSVSGTIFRRALAGAVQ